jgi:hypothetical protein
MQLCHPRKVPRRKILNSNNFRQLSRKFADITVSLEIEKKKPSGMFKSAPVVMYKVTTTVLRKRASTFAEN